MAALRLSFFLLFFPFSCLSTNPHVDIVTRNCANFTTHHSQKLITNYWKANSMIQPFVHRNQFGYACFGEAPLQVHVMAQCHGDLAPKDCNLCYIASRTFLPGCFPHVGGRVYLDGCFVRAENYSFYQETVTSEDTTICGPNEDAELRFSRGVVEMVRDLGREAPRKNGYDFGSVKWEEKLVYGMANCWNTLKEEDCRSCLEIAGSRVLSCLPATEGRALMAGCVIRYSDYNFINAAQDISSKYTILTLAIYTVTVAIVSLIAVSIGVFVGRVMYHQSYAKGMERGFLLLDKSLRFKYSTLEKATDNFSVSNNLGHGGTGEVFKGSLEDGREIAVKRLFLSSNCEDFYNEVNVISRAKHKNLVRFLGCSFSSHDSLLVYELLPNRSLNSILFDPERKKELDWKKRLGILIGTAEGLEYLHRYCAVKIVHRDIKSYNILLDLKYRPKIADFGLAKLYANDESTIHNALEGTLGYMAPEYIAKGQLTEKVDVYSYGVLVLEIISGAQNIEFKQDNSIDTLVTSTWKHFQTGSVSEIIDESLEVEFMEEIKRAVHVGLLCTQEVPSLRPSMTQILEMLRQKDYDLPMPSKPPFIDESMEIANHNHETTNFNMSSDGSSKCRSDNIDDRR